MNSYNEPPPSASIQLKESHFFETLQEVINTFLNMRLSSLLFHLSSASFPFTPHNTQWSAENCTPSPAYLVKPLSYVSGSTVTALCSALVCRDTAVSCFMTRT